MAWVAGRRDQGGCRLRKQIAAQTFQLGVAGRLGRCEAMASRSSGSSEAESARRRLRARLRTLIRSSSAAAGTHHDTLGDLCTSATAATCTHTDHGRALLSRL